MKNNDHEEYEGQNVKVKQVWEKMPKIPNVMKVRVVVPHKLTISLRYENACGCIELTENCFTVSNGHHLPAQRSNVQHTSGCTYRLCSTQFHNV